MAYDDYIIKPGKMADLRMYIENKYPDDSEGEIHQVYLHAVNDFLIRHIISVRDDIDSKVVSKLTKDLLGSDDGSLKSEELIRKTLREVMRAEGEFCHSHMLAIWDWMKRRDHKESVVEDHYTALIDMASSEKKALESERTLQKLVVYEQLDRVKKSMEMSRQNISKAKKVQGSKCTERYSVVSRDLPNGQAPALQTKKTDHKTDNNRNRTKSKRLQAGVIMNTIHEMLQRKPDISLDLLKSIRQIKIALSHILSQSRVLAKREINIKIDRSILVTAPALVLIVVAFIMKPIPETSHVPLTPMKVPEYNDVSPTYFSWESVYNESLEIKGEQFDSKLAMNNEKYNPFPYSDQNWAQVRAYLASYNSVLADPPYFEVIIDVGMQKNLDPRLLFAITGQEQSFVRKGSINAKRIANNPFNVYTSWKDYNTGIRDSAEIAANTVLNTMAQIPYNVHPIKALNDIYAEDPRWWIGVDYFYNEMLELEDSNINMDNIGTLVVDTTTN